MKERIQQCPRCGSLIIKIINQKTNESFYKCSNQDCHFRLRINYEEEDIFLQGKKLNTTCKGCGYPLEVACGPNGLYARCYQCSVDTNPKNGLPKWSNARSFNAKAEIKLLREQYIKESQINYGFNENEPYYVVEESPEGIIEDIQESFDDEEEVREQFKEKLNFSFAMRELIETLEAHPNTMMSADELAIIAKVQAVTVRNYLKQLREIGEVKIVGYKDNGLGPLLALYQSKNSNLKPLKIFTKEEGYDTVANFYKVHRDLFNPSVTPTSIAQAIKSSKIEMVPLMTSNGIMRGYPEETLKHLSYLLKDSSKLNEEPLKKEPETVKQLSLNLKEDTTSDLEDSSERKYSRDGLTIQEKILKYLKENINRGISSKELSSALSIPPSKAQHNIYLLKEQGKIKVVGIDHVKESKSGFYGVLVQVTSSSLPNLRVTKDLRRFTTLKRFLKTNSSIRMEAKKALKIVEEANLEEFPVLISKRIFKGYRVEDLRNVLSKAQGRLKRTPRKKRDEITVSSEISVEPVSSEVQVNPISVASPKEKEEGLLKAITGFFKRKKGDEELDKLFNKKSDTDVISF